MEFRDTSWKSIVLWGETTQNAERSGHGSFATLIVKNIARAKVEFSLCGLGFRFFYAGYWYERRAFSILAQRGRWSKERANGIERRKSG